MLDVPFLFNALELAMLLNCFPADSYIRYLKLPFYTSLLLICIFKRQPSKESCPEYYDDKLAPTVIKLMPNVSLYVVVLPSQDYWFSLVFKRLVGPRVLAVRVAGLQRKPQPGRVIRDKLRIYAHCTSYYKYVLKLTELGLIWKIHLNSDCPIINKYCDLFFIYFIFHYLSLTDDRTHILLAFQWSVTILLECPWRFKWKTDRSGFNVFHSMSSCKHLRLIVFWGRTKSLTGHSASHK